MENVCLKCGKPFKVRPSEVLTKRYCNKVCASKKETRPCVRCGVSVTRVRSQMLKVVYCGRTCANIGMASRLAEMNRQLNPTRMTLETRTKLRNARLGTGEGKGYAKTFGVHTHRIVASEKLGRPLRKGEVVHHKDEVKRNNDQGNNYQDWVKKSRADVIGGFN